MIHGIGVHAEALIFVIMFVFPDGHGVIDVVSGRLLNLGPRPCGLQCLNVEAAITVASGISATFGGSAIILVFQWAPRLVTGGRCNQAKLLTMDRPSIVHWSRYLAQPEYTSRFAL